ncbi:hypothetical protein [Chromobacterium sp. IIBBL 290-4]|uniref:hypothetical protein n=1 Tax=Chromobacterium sp. IIBBL 290-4 TaxID=2953890 RepID=UPI0020B6BBC7|nr:hypothetical protein [Chromobacterium sp. IIBBL 290-4]UTH76455.1 hypothetical protein NKT35_10265 [Chromobacterium sp. IIBBL 290-4]
MEITPEIVRRALSFVVDTPVDIAGDVPLIESRLKVNSLAMMALCAQLEQIAQVKIPQYEAMRLYAGSIDQIVSWFERNRREMS